MALDWQRIEEAVTTEASLWRLVDELHRSKPDTSDVERIERLLRFGNLPPKVYQCLDDALMKVRIRSTQRLEPVWQARLNPKEHAGIRDTLREDEEYTAEMLKAPTAVAPPDMYPIDPNAVHDDEDTCEVSHPELAALDAQPDTEEIEIEEGALDLAPTIDRRTPNDLFAVTTPMRVALEATAMSGMFAKPVGEIAALIPAGPYRLRFGNRVYDRVYQPTLLHLFRRGVLLGAEVFEDERWVSVSTHVDFEDLRTAVGSEIDRIVANTGGQAEITRPRRAAEIGPDFLDDDDDADAHTQIIEITEEATNVVDRSGDIEPTNIFEQELFEELNLDDSAVFMADDSDVTNRFAGDSDSWPFSGIFQEIDEFILSPEVRPAIRSYSDIPTLAMTDTEKGTQAGTPSSKGVQKDPATKFTLPPSVRVRGESETRPRHAREDHDPAEATAEVFRESIQPIPERPKLLEDIQKAEVEAEYVRNRRKDTEPLMTIPVPQLVARRRTRRNRQAKVYAAGSALVIALVGFGAIGFMAMQGSARKTVEVVQPVTPPNEIAIQQAQQSLHLSTAIPTDDPVLQRRVARELRQGGNHSGAVTIAHVADRLDPTPESALQLADWHFKAREFPEARRFAFEAYHRGGDASAALSMFGESLRLDPEMNAKPHRLDIKAIADHGKSDRTGEVSLLLDGKSAGRLVLATRSDKDRAARQVAATRLCAMMNCQFDLPLAQSVRVEREQLKSILTKQDRKRLRRLSWKKDDVTKMFYVDAALIADDSKVGAAFPVEVTKVWSRWLNPRKAKTVIKRRVTTFLLPWDALNADYRIDFGAAAEDISTAEIAAQLNSMLLFDILTSNTQRFEKRKKDWGQSVSMVDGKLRSLRHSNVFPAKRPRREAPAFKLVKSLNDYEAFALKAMKPDVVAHLLFPDKDKKSDARANLFWAKRNEVLLQTKQMKAK